VLPSGGSCGLRAVPLGNSFPALLLLACAALKARAGAEREGDTGLRGAGCGRLYRFESEGPFPFSFSSVVEEGGGAGGGRDEDSFWCGG
jgi:hypothetical protein